MALEGGQQGRLQGPGEGGSRRRQGADPRCQRLRRGHQLLSGQPRGHPDGSDPPSVLLKRNLAEFLESRKVITVEINLFDSVYRPVSVDADVFAHAGEEPNSMPPAQM